MIYILGASNYQLLCWAISVLRLLVPSQPSSHSPSSGQFLCSGYNTNQMLLLFRMCSAGVSDICASSNLSDQYQLLAWISTDQRWSTEYHSLSESMFHGILVVCCSHGLGTSRVSRGEVCHDPTRDTMGWADERIFGLEYEACLDPRR
jgi:hypothetical protein